MRPQHLLITILLFSMITGCKNPGCDPANMNVPMSLEGKWQVVQDSISNSMLRTSAITTNYIGTAGDYFDFRNDSVCYTKEGNVYDTLAYRLVSSKSIVLQKFGLIVNGTVEPSILSRTPTTANITTQNILSPGGTIFREVKLKR